MMSMEYIHVIQMPFLRLVRHLESEHCGIEGRGPHRSHFVRSNNMYHTEKLYQIKGPSTTRV